jgi:heme oxygenase
MWTATKGAHEQIRRTRFISALTARRLPWKAYGEWLAQLYFLHESLGQAEQAMAGDAASPILRRSTQVSLPALADDLRFLFGASWQRSIRAYPATAAYCTHLRELAVRETGGFAAHHCARHLEDLAAGLDVTPAVSAAYRLDDRGRRFLTPADISLPLACDTYEHWLNTGSYTPAHADVLVTNIIDVHDRYLEIVRQLGRSWT